MKSIRKKRNGYVVLFSVGVCLMLWLSMAFMLEAVFIFGAINIIVLLLLVRQNRMLIDATLLWDNRILTVSTALISMPSRHIRRDIEETVVSTFGILMGNKIYRWGQDGVQGVRLHTIQIDKEWMELVFGDKNQTMRVELRHGMLHKQAVLDATQKMLHETGVMAAVNGW